MGTNRKTINHNSISRRGFIKYSALGSAALTFAPNILSAKFSTLISDNKIKSKVVVVKHTKVIDGTGKVDTLLLRDMLNKGMLEFTGKNSLPDAWKLFFSPDDVVGLKLSALGLRNIEGTNLTDHYSAVTNEIVKGLKYAGLEESNIIVWDRSDEELQSAGFEIQKETGQLRIFGHNSTSREPSLGFTDQTFPVGDKSTHLSIILHDMCTAILNVPIPKHHGTAGLTCALKSHYGTIDNAREFHSNGCTSPGIPEVNLIPAIRDKQRLIICDALLGLFDGGPRWNRQFAFPYGAIIIGTDPVAIDTVALSIVDDKRIEMGLSPIKDYIKYLTISEEFGLGNSDKNFIDLVEINLG